MSFGQQGILTCQSAPENRDVVIQPRRLAVQRFAESLRLFENQTGTDHVPVTEGARFNRAPRQNLDRPMATVLGQPVQQIVQRSAAPR